MKVRPSVKKMCEKCKVIRRHGRVHGDLREPPSQAAPGLKEKNARMARISGVDIPREKRLEISLTYIFGIGKPTAQKICADTGLDPNQRVRNLTEDEVNQIRVWVDAEPHRRG